jgi:hypothetical protein
MAQATRPVTFTARFDALALCAVIVFIVAILFGAF